MLTHPPSAELQILTLGQLDLQVLKGSLALFQYMLYVEEGEGQKIAHCQALIAGVLLQLALGSQEPCLPHDLSHQRGCSKGTASSRPKHQP